MIFESGQKWKTNCSKSCCPGYKYSPTTLSSVAFSKESKVQRNVSVVLSCQVADPVSFPRVSDMKMHCILEKLSCVLNEYKEALYVCYIDGVFFSSSRETL